MDRANARAGQHCISRLWDHRHIDDNTVTFSNTHVFQNVREFADMTVQVFVGDMKRIIRRAVRLPNDRSLITPFG